LEYSQACWRFDSPHFDSSPDFISVALSDISTAAIVLQRWALLSPEDLEFDTFMVVGVKHGIMFMA
jgi:hypothetical protein